MTQTLTQPEEASKKPTKMLGSVATPLDLLGGVWFTGRYQRSDLVGVERVQRRRSNSGSDQQGIVAVEFYADNAPGPVAAASDGTSASHPFF
jgi:hypothetical protein